MTDRSDLILLKRIGFDRAAIERGAAEVRGALRQLEDGRIEQISPGALAEDVLRAALDEEQR